MDKALPATREFWREKLDELFDKQDVLFMTSDVADGERLIGTHRVKPKWDRSTNNGDGNFADISSGATFQPEEGEEDNTDYSVYPPWLIDVAEGTIEFPTLMDEQQCPIVFSLNYWSTL